MAMVVRSNLMAYNANRQLGMNNSAVSKNLEKLSSGFKINRAADDAAGLAISEKMKAQIKGLETASSNSQDGISLVQTAEGALTEVHDMLNRMTELATKSANGTIKDEVDREAIQNEVNKLNEEIDRISQSTNFNGINLLDGSLSTSGKSSSGAAAAVSLSDNVATSEVEAVKAQFSSAALASSFATTASGGEVLTYNISTDDGKVTTVKLTFDSENKTFIGDNGKTYGVTADTNKILASEVANAFAAALKDTDIGKNYKISQVAAGSAQLQFDAKVAGGDVPKIVSISQEQLNNNGTIAMSTAAMAISEVKTGADAYATISDVSDLTLFDGTNAKDSVFTVNGKKFAIVACNADSTLIGKLDSDVNIIRAEKLAIAKSDAQAIVNAINHETGLNLSVGADGEIKLVDKGSEGSKATGGLTLQIGDTGEDFNQVTVSVDNMSSKGIGTEGLDVSKQETAKAAIETIKTAINKVSTNRSEMGALQNRLEHTINNLDVAAENMTNANSRIRDTDMAKQMMEYTKMNVLTQSAQAMLAQANQNPQSILQLLQ